MKTLTHIDSNFVSQSIKGPHDLYTYLYVNELMIRLLPKGLPNQELYDLYQNFVELARADAISELDLRVFELDLLDVLGYGINFDTDTKDNSEFEDSVIYSYIPEKGFHSAGNAEGFRAEEILKDWEINSNKFIKVIPSDYKRMMSYIEKAKATNQFKTDAEIVDAAFDMHIANLAGK